MKRFGYLFEHVSNFHALVKAANKAALGKKAKPRVARFIEDLETEVIALERELLEKTYRPLPYHTFRVHDPKERMICAADFRDRVVHHALCAVLAPLMERSSIFDSYACRKEKGTHRALARAQHFCRRFGFFIKLDVHKFFDSVDHGVLKYQIRRIVKDPGLLWLADIFIDHPVPWTAPGKGIPIGNLTSQHFANFYLSGLDHFIKETLRIRGYVRYMDDMVLFADDKDILWDACERVAGFLQERLQLRLKDLATLLAPVSQGLSFLGFRVFPGVIRVRREGWRRFRHNVLKQDELLQRGEIDEERWSRSMASLIGHVVHADTRNLRAAFFERPGAYEAPTG